jgi:two-component system sensor histidine kinase/response regulator
MPMRSQNEPPPSRVLIVDDTASNVEILSTILTAEGYEVLSASDGETGLRLALDCNPDLVLLDLVLPGIMGIEVLEILKHEQPDTIVILTTAFGSEETAIQAMRRGVNDYIINKRPFDSDEVREVVRRARNEAQLRRENARLQRELASANEQLKEYSGSLERTVEELRTANERLKELDHAKASFFSMISHELRHPLTVAKGYLELVTASGASLEPETRGYLAIVEQNLRNLAKMLDDLLDLSRMEAGHYQIDRQAERVATLVSQTVLALGAAASAKEIKLQSDLPAAIPLVSADPQRIAQVLANLVDNALKFTPRGGSINLTARELPSEVELIVSDTGIGITASELEKIFERFYQIKNPAVPHSEGAGLGLAISREIVRLHGGQIWATSQVGRGTQLHFTLPKIMDTESP